MILLFLARLLKEYLKRFLSRFVAEGRVYSDGVLGFTGGLVPVNGSRSCVQSDGVLLVGDAGGMANPFNGAGIACAVVSGEVAGQMAASALGRGGSGTLRDYGSEITRRIPTVERKEPAEFGHLVEQLDCVSTWRG